MGNLRDDCLVEVYFARPFSETLRASLMGRRAASDEAEANPRIGTNSNP